MSRVTSTATPLGPSRLCKAAEYALPGLSGAYVRGFSQDHAKANGAEGDRTLNLSIANAALSQLSYRPGSSLP